MKKGKNVPTGSSHWTSLENLYDLNIALLSTKKRRTEGWGKDGDKFSEYKRFRPDDDDIDQLAEELFERWNAVVGALPVLGEDPNRMRVHNPQGPEHTGADNVLFWPIGQQMLVGLVQELFDEALAARPAHAAAPTADEALRTLEPLNEIVWDAHRPPWRHLLLLRSGDDNKWRITNEDRKPRIRVAERVIRWQLGLDRLSEEQLTGPSGLQETWRSFLFVDAVKEVDEMWKQIEAGALR